MNSTHLQPNSNMAGSLLQSALLHKQGLVLSLFYCDQFLRNLLGKTNWEIF